MADHEMARQTDAGERDPRAASNLDVHHGQQNRQATTPHEHHVKHRVVWVVVLLLVAREPVHDPQQLPARERQRAGVPHVRPAACESAAPRTSSLAIAPATSTSRNSAPSASAKTSRAASGAAASTANEGIPNVRALCPHAPGSSDPRCRSARI